MGEASENPMSDTLQFKVLICGDGAIDKTCLLDTLVGYCTVDWNDPKYEPTAAANLLIEREVKMVGTSNIEIWDTAGQEALEALRQTAYPGTDVLLIGFNTCEKVTLENIADTWYPDFNEFCKDCKAVIMVGTKYDLYQEKKEAGEDEELVTDEAVMAIAQKIGANSVIMTSALTAEGVCVESAEKMDHPPTPSYWNCSEDDEGFYLHDQILSFITYIHNKEAIPVITPVAAAAAPAPAEAPAAPEASAPAPAPAPAKEQKKDDSCCTVL